METIAANNGTGGQAEAGIDPARDAAYFRLQRDHLMADHADQFVAIRGEEVVAVADTYFGLHAKLCERYGGPAYAYIRKVCPASFREWDKTPAYLVL